MSLSQRLGQGDSDKAKSFPDLSKLTEELNPRYEQPVASDNSIKNQVLETLIQSLGQQLYSGQVEEDVLEQHVYEAIASVISSSQRSLTSYDRAELVQN
ncbi:MAG: hypothetical protein F2938_00005, partial [Actinobacteria bacterium]|nr:hypothetical protein [Actinomycetota bacterium]